MPEIKERPILFSAPMVRAILEGRKTVTRRAVNPQPVLTEGSGFSWKGHLFGSGSDDRETARNFSRNCCPNGKPGDRLWVRESWWQAGDWQATYPEDDTGAWLGSRRVIYSADGTPPNEPNTSYPNGLRNGAYSAAAPNKIWRHRPSIHMNRWASRILLEITDVKVERLQDISDEQAQAEGCFFTDYGRKCFHGGRGVRDATECEYPDAKHDLRDGWMWDKTTSHEQCLGAPRWAFANLWLSTGGDWDANPWVWAISFKQVTP